MESGRLPLSRNHRELLIEQLPGELLVFDRVQQRAHSLGRLASTVFRHCDGRTTREQLVAVLAAEGLPASEEALDEALGELSVAGLLQRHDAPAHSNGPSRRQVLRRVAFIAGVAVAYPLVESIVAPRPAQAASCIATGVPAPGGNCSLCCSQSCIFDEPNCD